MKGLNRNSCEESRVELRSLRISSSVDPSLCHSLTQCGWRASKVLSWIAICSLQLKAKTTPQSLFYLSTLSIFQQTCALLKNVPDDSEWFMFECLSLTLRSSRIMWLKMPTKNRKMQKAEQVLKVMFHIMSYSNGIRGINCISQSKLHSVLNITLQKWKVDST